MRRTIGIAFHRDRRNGYDGTGRKTVFETIELRIPLREAEAPAVIVDDDLDMVGIVEGRSASVEGGVIEGPFRRGKLPDQLCEVPAIPVVTGTATLGGEVILVPPGKLRLRRQRHAVEFLASDQIAADGHQGLAAFRPERRDDVCRPRSPIEAGQDRSLDVERIHESDEVRRECRLLAVAWRPGRAEACRPIPPQMRNYDAVASRGED